MQSLVVLHRRPLGEHGWLLNVFAEQGGHQRLLAPRKTPVQLWQLYQGEWRSEKEWARLAISKQLHDWPLQQQQWFCGCYLAELLVRLLPDQEPFPQLFELYCRLMTALSEGVVIEPWLRMFEYRLLCDLGYGFAWNRTSDGAEVRAELDYLFDPQHGFTVTDPIVSTGHGVQPVKGLHLLNIAAGKFDFSCLASAKQLLRQALAARLERPLESRRLYAAPDF